MNPRKKIRRLLRRITSYTCYDCDIHFTFRVNALYQILLYTKTILCPNCKRVLKNFARFRTAYVYEVLEKYTNYLDDDELRLLQLLVEIMDNKKKQKENKDKNDVDDDDDNNNNDNNADLLESIINIQRRYNKLLRKARKVRFPRDKNVERHIANLCTAIIHEACELRDLTNWKWWKSTKKEFDVTKAKEELIDILHFVIDIAILLKMNAKDIYDVYVYKNNINKERLKNNY